jgi:hypothetical protein
LHRWMNLNHSFGSESHRVVEDLKLCPRLVYVGVW